MKKSFLAIGFTASALLCGAAQAQPAGAYPSQPAPSSSASPFPNLPLQSDTSPYPGLRERSYSAAPPAPAVQDTPQSRQLYDQCQKRANREATSDAVMRQDIAQCLNELAQRRQQGQ